jgi:hypothetical protein
VVFDDDGPGPHPPALYVSGNFDMAGGVPANRTARWTGSRWEGIDTDATGFTGPGDMAVFDDDGPGPHLPALYMVGRVGSFGAIAKWDGRQLTIAASGWPLFLDGPDYETVTRLFVLPDGGTGALHLFAGQSISHVSPAGESITGALYRMDGSTWTQVAAGGVPSAAAVWDPDGSGPASAGIYVAHTQSFYPTSGSQGYSSTWVSLLTPGGYSHLVASTSFTEPWSYSALATFDDGSGTSLYVGGYYPLASGGPAAPHLARWNGSGLTPIVGDVNDRVSRLQVLLDDPAGSGQSALYAIGAFTSIGGVAASGIARQTGGSWSALGPGFQTMNSGLPVQLVAFDDDGPGIKPRFLYAVGGFTEAGYSPARGIARWDGRFWEPPGAVLNNVVNTLAAADVGQGSSLYLGGAFTTADGLTTVGVARWDGQVFSQLTDGMDDRVNALAVYSGSLYAAGRFTEAGGAATGSVARWTGTTWEPLADGVHGPVDSLAVYNGELYAGGEFALVYGWIARWNGSRWASVGSGINGQVQRLCVNDGALYAAGLFTTAGTEQAPGLARWDGAEWHATPPPPISPINAIASYDGALYIAGSIPAGPGVFALHGGQWYTLPAIDTAPGATSVNAMLTIDSASGTPGLYASKTFSAAGSTPETSVVRWDGRAWATVAGGFDAGITALSTLGAGSLYAGGSFLSAGGQPSWFLAGLAPCPAPCYANCDGSTTAPTLNINDFTCFLNLFAAGDPRANCDRSTVSPALNVTDFICFLNQFAAGCS